MKSTLHFTGTERFGLSRSQPTRFLLEQILAGSAVSARGRHGLRQSAILLILILGCAFGMNAQFASGNLTTVMADASANNTTVSVVEVSPTAAGAVSTVAIPGSGASAIRVSGSATSTLYLSNSDDGTKLLFTGANSTSTSSNANTLNPRAVCALDANKNFTIATTYTGGSGDQTRGAATVNNSTYFIGDQGGLFTNGSTSPSPSGNYRSVKSFGGNVYVFTASSSSAPLGLMSAATGGTFTALPGLPTGSSAFQDFYLISSGSNGSTFDVLYMLSTSSSTAGLIYKYSLVGGTWAANGTYTTNFGGFGMAAKKQGTGAYLFISSGTGATTANNLVRLTDTAGYNATIAISTASNMTLYTAPTGKILKGVAFTPAAVSPISVTGNFAAVNTTYGTASAATSVSVSGAGLTADILVTPPAGFEVSKTSGSSGFAATQTLAQSAGSIAPTNVYLRLAATTTAGIYSGDVLLTSASSSVNAPTVNSTVSAKSITVSGAIAQDKAYDRSTAATITGAVAQGLVNSDVITVSGNGNFSDFLAANDKPVTASLVLNGTNAASYTLTQPTGLTADITPKDVTLSSVVVAEKEYDGTTEASLTATLNGVISPDDVSLNAMAGFSNGFVGSGIPVTSFSTLSGADAFNYNLVQPTGLTGTITAKVLTIENATAQNKVYDGTTAATITGNLVGVIAPDEVSFDGTGVFDSPNVGLNIPVTATITLSGDTFNYTLEQPTGLSANISADELQPQTITFDALPAVIYGDTAFTLTATASSDLPVSYSSSDETVATVSGNTVTILKAGTTVITATQSGDLTYDSAEPVMQTLDVLQKELTIASATAQDKEYDANTGTTITGTLSGIVGSDDVDFVGTAAFQTAQAGNSIAVNASASLTGADSANYYLTQPAGLTANITPKELTVQNAAADDKIYDTTTFATVSTGDLVGVLNNDDVTLAGTEGVFITADAGLGIQVFPDFTLAGNDAGNYTLAQPSLFADITPAEVYIFGLDGVSKVYDATVSATVTGTAFLDGILGSDEVTLSGSPVAEFGDKNVGISKPIFVSGYTLEGAQAGNYTPIQPSEAVADITVATLTISGAMAQDKIYDGTTNATISGTLSGILGTDEVTLVGTGQFASAAIGNNIAVTSTATLAGTDGANYVIDPQPTGLSADILDGPSVLSVGDLSVIGFQLNAPDTFAFVTWVDLSEDTLIKFTDNGFLSNASANATNNARGGENFVIWKNTAGMIPAGTVITISDTGSAVTSMGSIVSGNLNGLSSSGDEIFAYQGVDTSGSSPDYSSNSNPTTFNGNVLFGIFMQGSNGASNWLTSGSVTSNTSYLPSELNVANANIALGSNASRGQYIGSRSNQASFEAYKAMVTNPSNWTTASGSGTTTFDATAFTLVSGPDTAVISGNTTICAGDNANFSIEISGGTAPYSVVYSDGSTEFTLSGYNSGANVTVTPSLTTTYTLVSVADANSMEAMNYGGTATVTVNQTYPFFADADNDGYGAGIAVMVCAENGTTPPAGYSLDNTDCNDAVAAIHPNAAEIPFNGIDDDCDGTIDEGSQIFSQVLASQCGTTLASISSLIGAVSFGAPVDGYRFKVVNTVTLAEQTIDRNVPHFQLTQLASFEYATTYDISVQLRRNGQWLNYYGPVCQISTPAILANGGAAAVNPSQCGIALPSLSTLIATTSLPGVTGYRFRITDTANNQQQLLDRTLNWFSLTMLSNYLYGRTYSIEVAVKTNGNYSGFGQPCVVSTPAVPTLADCGQIVATSGSLVSTTSLNRVTSYRFQLTNMNDFTTTVIDRSVHYFSFHNVPGFQPGAEYVVNVAVMTAGNWSDYGESCTITAPGAARISVKGSDENETMAVNFRAVAYPNPYSESFALDMDTVGDTGVAVRVYDMLGKLVEQREFAADAIEIQQFGERYPSGVYQVVVSQGGSTTTLRIIKR